MALGDLWVILGSVWRYDAHMWGLGGAVLDLVPAERYLASPTSGNLITTSHWGICGISHVSRHTASADFSLDEVHPCSVHDCAYDPAWGYQLTTDISTPEIQKSRFRHP